MVRFAEESSSTEDGLELVSLAAELRPLLARNATRAERGRRLSG